MLSDNNLLVATCGLTSFKPVYKSDWFLTKTALSSHISLVVTLTFTTTEGIYKFDDGINHKLQTAKLMWAFDRKEILYM